MKSLGQRIRELREARDLSLREFAKQLDASPAHISDIENDRRFPSPPLLRSMAQHLRADVEELKKLDVRPPMADLRRIARNEPAFGLALRKLAEKNITSDEIMELAKKKPDRE